MHKFSLNQRVFIKTLNEVGTISTRIMRPEPGNRIRLLEGYEVAIPSKSSVWVYESDIEDFDNRERPCYDKGFEIKLKECQCGMEKHGFANHSTWCPKHE